MRVQASKHPNGHNSATVSSTRMGTSAGTRGASDEAPRGTETVLVVDDDEMVLELVVELVTDLGYHVLSATDGASALVVLNGSEPIDLLFTDVVMPNHLNGYELARAARRRQPDLKILLTSAYPRLVGGTEEKSVDFPCLPKPYHRGQLARSFRDILDAG